MVAESQAKDAGLRVRGKLLALFTLAFAGVFGGVLAWAYSFVTTQAMTHLRSDLNAVLVGASPMIVADDLAALARDGEPSADGFSADPRYARALFSVAATAWTLLVGRPVHEGANAGELILAAATRQAAPLLTAAPATPAAVAAVIDRALRFDPKGRYATAEEMRAAWLAAIPPASRIPSPLAPRPALGAPSSTARNVRLVLACVAIVVAVAGVVLGVFAASR